MHVLIISTLVKGWVAVFKISNEVVGINIVIKKNEIWITNYMPAKLEPRPFKSLERKN